MQTQVSGTEKAMVQVTVLVYSICFIIHLLYKGYVIQPLGISPYSLKPLIAALCSI